MSQRTALLLASATCDWASTFCIFVAVFATFDGRTSLALGFVGIALMATCAARFLGGLRDP